MNLDETTQKQKELIKKLLVQKLGNSTSPFEQYIAKEFKLLRLMRLTQEQASAMITTLQHSVDLFEFAETLYTTMNTQCVGKRRATFIDTFFKLADATESEIDENMERELVTKAAHEAGRMV